MQNLVKFEVYCHAELWKSINGAHSHTKLELVSERGGYVSPEVQDFAQICSIAPAGTTRYTDHREIWHERAYHSSTVLRQISR